MYNIKIFAQVFLVFVFLSPLVGTLLSTIGLDSEARQFSGLQLLVMGVYNLPFIIVSLATFSVGNRLYMKENKNASILFLVSIISSVAGTVLMLLWGLGIFS